MRIDREAILKAFESEAEEHLGGIEQGVVALETRPGDAELLTSIFRMAHTFKGAAAVAGLPGVAAFAHSLEDVLDRLRNHSATLDAELASLVLGSVDALRAMIPAAVAGDEKGPAPALKAIALWLAKQGEARPSEVPSGSMDPGAVAGAERARAPLERSRPSLRVDVDKLDRMLDLTGEIAIARGRLASLLEERGAAVELRDAHRDAERLFLELQELVMQARMVPIGPTFRQHVRTVRDLATAQGKLARLCLEGEDVEMDMALVEAIRDPLTHMIRNAVDHGIEAPAARKEKGKDPVGTVILRARHMAGKVVIQVGDDGAGLDRERIIARAKATGCVQSPEAMSDEQLFDLVFLPGFSTAETVTEISGRGIGMDVVRRNVETLRGTVSLMSLSDAGTTVTLELPLTLAIIEGFSVGVGSETYVIPLESVVECVELPPEEGREGRDRGVINLRGQPLPYLRLSRLFALEDAAAGARESVVVIQHDGGHAGLAVERLLGEGQTVIKPLSRLFKRAPGVSASALLGNGRVALILDVPALLRAALQTGARPGDVGEAIKKRAAAVQT